MNTFTNPALSLESRSQSRHWKSTSVVDANAANELQERAVPGNGMQQQSHDAALPPLLLVDPRKLRGEEEMRRIFGARILREEERDNAGGDVIRCIA